MPQQRHNDGHITGHITHVDRFGNLITDVPGGWMTGGRWCVEVAGQQFCQSGTTYADAEIGAFLILVGSADTVEIAVRDGNAAARLGVRAGEIVTLRPVTGAW
jgi:S-adenosylmethionine hydrolase